ncbi:MULTISPECIES: hypothetical protein [Sulfitobacter]|uniref:Uncharacterized protein n=1 Tax=Sulfitobacter profundi TaxID=2679961 RepID=A0ABW1YTA5_9RHOB|nr:hypothetical protein [Sulfitobacter indolifex]
MTQFSLEPEQAQIVANALRNHAADWRRYIKGTAPADATAEELATFERQATEHMAIAEIFDPSGPAPEAP